MPEYKWTSPQEWLLEKAQQHASAGAVDELLGIINAIVPKLDADSVQDDFQNEMDADGYFKSRSDTTVKHG